jgi:hypothetical protein
VHTEKFMMAEFQKLSPVVTHPRIILGTVRSVTIARGQFPPAPSGRFSRRGLILDADRLAGLAMAPLVKLSEMVKIAQARSNVFAATAVRDHQSS